MSHNRPFHFRHFSLMHHQSTMKVGTDAILLGAWVDVDKVTTVLDIGTGSGIIPLMIAQRNSMATIVGVDIDGPSVAEAALNFKISQWRKRLMAVKADIRDFVTNCDRRFDLIVSNPPFFTHGHKAQFQRRNLARFTDTLPFSDHVKAAEALLEKNGKLTIVLPTTESPKYIENAISAGFSVVRCLNIVPVEGREPNRVIIEFKKKSQVHAVAETFVIRNSCGNFSDDYKKLLHNYYLGLEK
jgi:tRNA1Val (adenine37-N6)-methyltransferase